VCPYMLAPCPIRTSRISCNMRWSSDYHRLSLHDALPIFHFSPRSLNGLLFQGFERLMLPATDAVIFESAFARDAFHRQRRSRRRSEEHTSELQSRENLVCRLLLEKKKY